MVMAAANSTGFIHELSHHLVYTEAGVSGITAESSWFYDRSANPLGYVRLMLDLPRRDFGPWDCAKGFRSAPSST